MLAVLQMDFGIRFCVSLGNLKTCRRWIADSRPGQDSEGPIGQVATTQMKNLAFAVSTAAQRLRELGWLATLWHVRFPSSA